MFLGHFGVAFAFKRAEPKLSLGTLFLAVQLVDLLWGAFLLLGWEHVRVAPGETPLLTLQFYDYPIRHSLVGPWQVGARGDRLYYSWPTRDTTRHWQASVLVGAAVPRIGCWICWSTCPTCRWPATTRSRSGWDSGVTSA